MAKKQINSEKNNNLPYRKIAPEECRWTCPVDIFKFKSTSEIGKLDKIVGQPRAIEAINLGAKLKAQGFNIFVSGMPGTGRLSTVTKILENAEGYSDKFFDYCFVNNFKEPEKPTLLKMKNGDGKKLAKGMKSAISYLQRRLPKLFEDEDYISLKRKMVQDFREKEADVLAGFDEKIKPYGFVRGSYEGPQGNVIPDIFPMIEGQAVHIDALVKLVEDGKLKMKDAEKFHKDYEILHQDLFNLSRQDVKMLEEFKKSEAALDKATAEIVVAAAFKDLEEYFSDKKVLKYLNSVQDHILNNLDLFIKNQAPNLIPTEVEDSIPDSDRLAVFQVNIAIDNSNTQSPPIVIETTPSYSNLFGSIDKIYDKRGFWKSDFMKIKPGALMKADQGFLVMNADDLFLEEGVWNALKRYLMYGKLEMQPSDGFNQFSQTFLKPEPIQTNVKVILIGSYNTYFYLNSADKVFNKIFKINAQFDYATQNNVDLIENYTKFISNVCNEENLPHLNPSGMAALVEYSAELAGSQDKLSLHFSHLSNLVAESSYFVAGKRNLINREIIEKALTHRHFRNSLLQEKTDENILSNRIIIKTDGSSIGSINGLVIYTLGEFEYGEPSRITATASVGHAGIINIEREASMSGKLHNKAVLIISAFLRERFAQKNTLSLSASLAFEQAYDGVDGDSASLAEIYVLMSAIADAPINHSFAITGSMSQKGEAQPIGGVNEKIKGYWGICTSRGLTGKQGAIIPESNVKNLMLPKELISDVKSGKFSIFAVKKVEDAVPLLFGMDAGFVNEKGVYPENTLFGKVQRKLDEFYKLSKPKRDENIKPQSSISKIKSNK
ncbi:MAG: hypothetical protein A2X64_03460 [Ignavibacteria bacterium GWF2_33_9]|nr:MAG: hypothetical protein A2X64_03460 [Ignavibacteria bacterium GWF2_33_9]